MDYSEILSKLLYSISENYGMKCQGLFQVMSKEDAWNTFIQFKKYSEFSYLERQQIIEYKNVSCKIQVFNETSPKMDVYGQQYGLMCICHNLDIERKAICLSRVRQEPFYSFEYNKNNIIQHKQPETMYSISESLKFKYSNNLWT